MTVVFRAARAADADAAVPLIYQSGPASFDFVFTAPGKGSALTFLRSAFIDGAGEFGYRNHVVAIDGGNVVAVGGGWSGVSGFAFMFAAARQILRHYGLPAGLGVIFRGLRTEAIIPPPTRNRYYLGHLGVLPVLQSRGIGQALIQHLLESGKEQGFAVAALDVATTNPRGQALYEKLGFVVTAERLSTLRNAHGTVAAHRHMETPM